MTQPLAETALYRPLQAGDRAFLWEMLRWAVFTGSGEPATVEAVKALPLSAYVDGWMRPDDFGILASAGGAPIGAAWARFFPESTPGYGQVSSAIPDLSLSVLPEFRGQGVGSTLLARLVHQARQRAYGLSLSVSQNNPVRSLYRRLGFDVVDRRGDSLVMLITWDTMATNGPSSTSLVHPGEDPTPCPRIDGQAARAT